MEKTRSGLTQAGVLKRFRREVNQQVVQLQNRIPTSVLNLKGPPKPFPGKVPKHAGINNLDALHVCTDKKRAKE